MSGMLQIITGPGDLGLISGWLGADTGDAPVITPLGDGLAVRVIPTHADRHTVQYVGDGHGNLLDLNVIPPAAVTNPQANLAIIGPGVDHDRFAGLLEQDLAFLEAAGHRVRHRLTVRQSGVAGINLVDVTTMARDILRASGMVQVVGYAGATLLDVVYALGIPPWSQHLAERHGLQLWYVGDYDIPDGFEVATTRLASGIMLNGGPDAMTVAVTGVQEFHPEIAEHTYESLRRADLLNDDHTPGRIAATARQAIEDRTQIDVLLLGTGPDTLIDYR